MSRPTDWRIDLARAVLAGAEKNELPVDLYVRLEVAGGAVAMMRVRAEHVPSIPDVVRIVANAPDVPAPAAPAPAAPAEQDKAAE